MSRSKAENVVAKFFHRNFGAVLYPYPGETADLQTCCGLNIEVKREQGRSYRFKGEQIIRKEFDLAILVRERRGHLEYTIWPLNDIRALIAINEGFPYLRKSGLPLKPPDNLEWHRLECKCLT